MSCFKLKSGKTHQTLENFNLMMIRSGTRRMQRMMANCMKSNPKLVAMTNLRNYGASALVKREDYDNDIVMMKMYEHLFHEMAFYSDLNERFNIEDNINDQNVSSFQIKYAQDLLLQHYNVSNAVVIGLTGKQIFGFNNEHYNLTAQSDNAL
eukprot:325331_1